jgi:hypothetical protein
MPSSNLRDAIAVTRLNRMKKRARTKPPCQCPKCVAQREGWSPAGLAAFLAAVQQADDNEQPTTPTH